MPVKMSVVIPTYRYDNFPNLQEAVASLMAQSLPPEIVIVVGGDIHLYKQAQTLGVDEVVLDHMNAGATRARNMGVEKATGTVVAFFDDDQVAAPDWCEELWRVYLSSSLGEVGGAGGKNLPLWECPVPKYLPEEMYWLVGATHKGFTHDIGTCQIRNTFAGNISFRRDIFTRIGGWCETMGLSQGRLIQGEEPEICDRMREMTGTGFWYNPAAVVYNRVPGRKTKWRYLYRRAFWQGYTKRMLKTNGLSLETEGDYLGVVKRGVADRIRHPSVTGIGQAVSLVGLTGATGMGYIAKVVV